MTDTARDYLHRWLRDQTASQYSREPLTVGELWKIIAVLRADEHARDGVSGLPKSEGELAGALRGLAIAGKAEESGGRWKFVERVERETKQGTFF